MTDQEVNVKGKPWGGRRKEASALTVKETSPWLTVSVIPTELASDRCSRGEGPEKLLSAGDHSTPGSGLRQVYFYHRRLDPWLALWPVESFSSSCLWPSRASHVVRDGLERQRHHLPGSLRNFWGAPHKLEGKSNAKSKPPAISVTSHSVDNFCARDSEKPCPHMERQGDPGDLDST